MAEPTTGKILANRPIKKKTGKKTSINETGRQSQKKKNDNTNHNNLITQNAPTVSVFSPNQVHSARGDTVDCSRPASESKRISTAPSGNIFNNLSISASPLSSEEFKSSMINGDITGSESATDPADEVFQGEPEASCSSAEGWRTALSHSST